MIVRIKENSNEGVRKFYEQNPYPGLEDKLLFRNPKRIASFLKKNTKVLYPGCGTGHGIVAMKKLRPDLELFGLDLSKPSLELASKLAQKHGVTISFDQGDYSKDLPWQQQFDAIILEGTLHHTENPKEALKNLSSYLLKEGVVFIHLYGKKYHARRFEIIEMLNMLQGQDDDLQQRFDYYRDFQDFQNQTTPKDKVLDFSLRKLLGLVRQLISFRKREDRVVPWTENFTELNQLWLDQFAHPQERTYDVRETQDLLSVDDFKVIKMFSLGKVNIETLPSTWRDRVLELTPWDQFRFMELHTPQGGSVALLAKKAN